MSRRWLVGAAVGAVYLAVALLSFGSGLVPVRPLYDGFGPPPPYYWVDPPPNAETTDPAVGTVGKIFFDDGESLGLTSTTGDGQATAIFEPGAIEPVQAEESVHIEVQPIGPSRLGEPPEGMRIDGNGYRFEAIYEGSGEPVRLLRPVSVILRFPVHATTMVRLDEDVWSPVPGTQVIAASLQVFAQTDQLGMYAAAGPPPPGEGFDWRPVVLAVAGAAAAVAGWYYGRGTGRRPANRARRRRRER